MRFRTSYDFRLCNSFLKISSFLCITPNGYLEPIEKYRHKAALYVRIFLWTLILVPFYLISLYQSFIKTSFHYEGMHGCMNAFGRIVSSVFVLVSLWKVSQNIDEWNEFCRIILELADATKLLIERKRKRSFNVHLINCASQCILLVSLTVAAVIWARFVGFDIVCWHIFRRINYFFIWQLIFFSATLNNILTNRMTGIQRILEISFQSTCKTWNKPTRLYMQTILPHLNPDCSVASIRSVSCLFAYFCKAVRMFNALYGLQMFLIFSNSIINIVENLNNLRKSFTDFGDLNIGLTACLAVILDWVSRALSFTIANYFRLLKAAIMLLVIPCDRTDVKVKQLILTCSNIENLLPMFSEERKEMLNFIRLTQNKRSGFTAGGFIPINRRTVFGILSTISSYLVVTIQLK